MTLSVDIGDLVESGISIGNYGETLAANHTAADNRVDAASAGWQGQSATALAILTESWATTTSLLLLRLSDHAQGLHLCVHEFSAIETNTSQTMSSLGATADTATSPQTR